MRGHDSDFAARVAMLDDEALLQIVDAPDDHTPVALAAALAELDRRGGPDRVRAAREPDRQTNTDDRTQPLLIRRAFRRRERFTRGEFAKMAALALGLNCAAYLGPKVLMDIFGTTDDVLLPSGVFSLVAALFSIALLVGATARRLRDLNRSGWWALLALVPCLNWILAAALTIPPSAPRADPT